MVRVWTIVALFASLTPAAYAQQLGGAGTMQGEQGQYIVFFDFDSAALDTAAREVVAAAADDFQRTGAARLEVRGHADTSGSADYNEALSVRRSEAVAEELTRLRVPPAAIILTGTGETDLLVQTPDGVAEPRNRRTEIFIERPEPEPVAPPPPVAPAPVEEPPAVVAAPAEPPREQPRGVFSLGALYGFNLLDEGDDEETDDKTSHLAGLNLGFDYAFTDFTSLSLEQAGFYNFGTDDEGFGGRSAAGLNFFPAFMMDIIPYAGANVGYIYGSGIDDDFFAGPEIGINLGFLDAKVAYDIPFGRGLDEGIIFTTIGLGIRF